MTDILVVHACPKTRARLLAVLENEPSVNIIGATDSPQRTLSLLETARCDVLVADHDLRDRTTLQLIREVMETHPEAKVLVTGVPNHEETILQYLEEGAAGYVRAEATWADLVKGISAVHAGEFLISPELATAVMERIAKLKQELVEFGGSNTAGFTETGVELTPREQEVLTLISQGKSNREIAEALTIEVGTVKNHVHNLLQKLDVSSRAHAARVTERALPGENGSSTETALSSR